MAEDNEINAMIAVEILNQVVFDGEKPETGQVDSDGNYKSVVIYQRSTTDALDKYVRIDAVYVSVGACDGCGSVCTSVS